MLLFSIFIMLVVLKISGIVLCINLFWKIPRQNLSCLHVNIKFTWEILVCIIRREYTIYTDESIPINPKDQGKKSTKSKNQEIQSR